MDSYQDRHVAKHYKHVKYGELGEAPTSNGTLAALVPGWPGCPQLYAGNSTLGLYAYNQALFPFHLSTGIHQQVEGL